MYTEREHAKHVLKERFHSNYFTRYSGTDTQGSQEFLPNFSGCPQNSPAVKEMIACWILVRWSLGKVQQMVFSLSTNNHLISEPY